MVTDVQTPFLGTPLVPLKLHVAAAMRLLTAARAVLRPHRVSSVQQPSSSGRNPAYPNPAKSQVTNAHGLVVSCNRSVRATRAPQLTG